MDNRQHRTLPGLSRGAGYWTPALLVILITFACLAGGCSLPGSGGSASAPPTPAPETPAESPAKTPSGAGIPSELRESVALVRPAGKPDEIIGSAVVMSSQGLLVTFRDVVSGNVEVVLPNGEVYQPVLVSVEPDIDLALLKVPAERLDPARFSTDRLSEGAEVFATGYDGTPGSIGRMSGSVVRTIQNGDLADLRVRAPLLVETDINLVAGFVGGVLSDEDDGFAGVLVPGEDQDGNATAWAVSNWAVLSWLDGREGHLNALADEARIWERLELPGDWGVRHPDGWSVNVTSDDGTDFQADLVPDDPDASLQLSISVEPNQFGDDPDAFVQEMFADRGDAKLWGITQVDGNPLVRLTVAQEGALIDVAYLLGDELMVALSMTSGYQPASAPEQSDEARALFQTVLDSLDR